MCVICKETTELPKATGSADVKPASRIQEPQPGCGPQQLALLICSLDPTVTFDR